MKSVSLEEVMGSNPNMVKPKKIEFLRPECMAHDENAYFKKDKQALKAYKNLSLRDIETLRDMVKEHDFKRMDRFIKNINGHAVYCIDCHVVEVYSEMFSFRFGYKKKLNSQDTIINNVIDFEAPRIRGQ